MINENYKNLHDTYFFSLIAKKVNAFIAENPEREIIRLGIGDVTRPLAPLVVSAMQKAVQEMGNKSTFKGYGEEQGYEFLRSALKEYYKKSKKADLSMAEIFISDGAKSDLGNILDLFSADARVLIPDPVYPVYVDTNLMAGRNIVYINGNSENSFLPVPDDSIQADIIYLCSPNNPTGAVYSREQLGLWVDYALKNQSIILYDNAYEIFINDQSLPSSIYQIPGAAECAIEVSSFSKTAGFTGTRCGYTIVPEALVRQGLSLNSMWLRRQTTKFNGVSYIVQRGAEAVFTEEGFSQVMENIQYYRENARILSKTLDDLGIWHTGGLHAPYIWMKCPDRMGSWDFFDYLLSRFGIVTTPGAGFGAMGNEYMRLSSFGERSAVEKAEDLLKNGLKEVYQ
ncbi:MAG: LL-diaminopimelate aminotransferase [Treponema sp.]|nr:LL-diaminopimelate aminotransferase [Treponema sp.]